MKTCSTCLEDFSVEDMYTVNCAAAHRFCFDCTRRYVVARLQEVPLLLPYLPDRSAPNT